MAATNDFTKSRIISRQQNKWIPVSSDYEIGFSESVAVDSSGGSVTVTLPASPGVGQWAEVWLAAGTQVSLAGNGNTITGQQTPGGAGTYVYNHEQSVLTLTWDGNTWQAFSSADTTAQKYKTETASFNAFPGTSYQVDVNGGPITVTLPEDPGVPDLRFIHVAGDISANPVTFDPQTKSIQGTSETMTWDEYPGTEVHLHWSGTTWEVFVK